MKKIMAGLLVLSMLAILTSCSSAATSAADSSGSASDESSSESSSSSAISSSDTSSVTISDNSGNQMTIGSGSWPTSGVAASVPKLGKGNITSTLTTSSGTMITIDSVNDADATAYYNTIKQQYPNNAMDLAYSGGFTYSGDNGTVAVSLSYGSGSILVTISEKK